MMKNKLNEIIKTSYPQGVHLAKTTQVDDKLSASINSVIPRVIVDDKKNKRYVKFLVLKDVGKISIAKSGSIYKTDIDKVKERIADGTIEIRLKAEQIVLSSIYENLSKIAMIRTALNPIYSILKRVLEGGFYKKDLQMLGSKKEKYLRYLKFLTDLNIIREQKDKFSEGNYFIEVRKHLEKKNDEIVLNKVFGLTIRDGKSYLLETLHFNVLKPFIRISNTYYLSSVLTDNLLSLTRESLFKKYVETYGVKSNRIKFDSQLDQLDFAGILKENEYISGKKKIFAEINAKMNSYAFS